MMQTEGYGRFRGGSLGNELGVAWAQLRGRRTRGINVPINRTTRRRLHRGDAITSPCCCHNADALAIIGVCSAGLRRASAPGSGWLRPRRNARSLPKRSARCLDVRQFGTAEGTGDAVDVIGRRYDGWGLRGKNLCSKRCPWSCSQRIQVDDFVAPGLLCRRKVWRISVAPAEQHRYFPSAC